MVAIPSVCIGNSPNYHFMWVLQLDIVPSFTTIQGAYAEIPPIAVVTGETKVTVSGKTSLRQL